MSDHFESRGLHRLTAGLPLHALPEATGWSWTAEGRALRLQDARQQLVAGFELATEFDRTWHARAKATGRILLYIGEDLVSENGEPVPIQLGQALAAGTLVAGFVTK